MHSQPDTPLPCFPIAPESRSGYDETSGRVPRGSACRGVPCPPIVSTLRECVVTLGRVATSRATRRLRLRLPRFRRAPGWPDESLETWRKPPLGPPLGRNMSAWRVYRIFAREKVGVARIPIVVRVEEVDPKLMTTWQYPLLVEGTCRESVIMLLVRSVAPASAGEFGKPSGITTSDAPPPNRSENASESPASGREFDTRHHESKSEDDAPASEPQGGADPLRDPAQARQARSLAKARGARTAPPKVRAPFPQTHLGRAKAWPLCQPPGRRVRARWWALKARSRRSPSFGAVRSPFATRASTTSIAKGVATPHRRRELRKSAPFLEVSACARGA